LIQDLAQGGLQAGACRVGSDPLPGHCFGVVELASANLPLNVVDCLDDSGLLLRDSLWSSADGALCELLLGDGFAREKASRDTASKH